MKNLLLFLMLSISALSGIILAHADVYVVTNPQGGVYSISDQDDAVVPSGYNVTVLKGKNIQNLPIIGSSQLYNFNNGSFSVNAAAVTARQNQQAQAIAQQQAIQKARVSAIEKLTDALTKVDVKDVLTNQEMNALLPS